MIRANRCNHERLHHNLAPGAACDAISKAEADDIVTPRRAPRGRTTTPAASRKPALSHQLPLTPPSTAAQAATGSPESTESDPLGTPTPAPLVSHFGLPALSGFTPQGTQESAVEQQSDEDSGIGENIIVASRRSAQASGGVPARTIVERTPQSEISVGNNINLPARQPIVLERESSSASTQVVPETVFDRTPSLGEAGPSGYHDPSYRRHSSADPEPNLDNIAQHMTNLEIQHLRRSRAQYAHELEESTGLVNRLQTRRQIHEADAVINHSMLEQLNRERRDAWDQASEAEYQRRRTRKRLGVVLAMLVIMVSMYGCWCVYMSAEFEYINKRRIEVLRE
ncbi:hypothetical protein CLAFUW4_05968 [Fulvia fulva]|uniref:Uncharacterized protein n=1 Tax=Passalora fulva TaxID=5499 RepID=A0A9Q8LJP3_PASFU|nr:uncharacterized protein CLAFUR5_06113 [Fulvia fulva]KAK4624216.1 hypothetical protein CLAFUR4_05973 [Fulvia fulva]KAK4625282.1 hypothetical protein CLAFUR0_05976 [Fulvia fulva]UJO17918.1 hypothetical protein CLAFUR5_06113 [Fulvia fulva]WPV15059.1 hypothetical protein CLAFUW4_05968 [Fulvia fulva]WPV30165.1 hypothetical protein CLAFUW7_05966 [Fulvia fulva]